MEEKEVRIPILGVIDVDKLEHHDDIHLFQNLHSWRRHLSH